MRITPYRLFLTAAIIMGASCMLGLPLGAQAVMQNNSDSINLAPITDAEAPLEQVGDSTETPAPVLQSSGDTAVATEQTDVGEITVIVGVSQTSVGSSAAASGAAVPATAPTSGTGASPAAPSAVIETLTASGAYGGAQVGTSGAGGIFVSGERTRTVLSEAGVARIIVKGWDPKTKKFITVTEGRVPPDGGTLARANEDIGVLAASAALDDGRLGQMIVDSGIVELDYRSSGRILYVFPKTFVLKVRVDTNQPAGSRIALTYPWYRFMTWLTVPEQRIVAEIEAALDAAALGAAEADRGARALTVTTAALKRLHQEYERGIRLVL